MHKRTNKRELTTTEMNSGALAHQHLGRAMLALAEVRETKMQRQMVRRSYLPPLAQAVI